MCLVSNVILNISAYFIQCMLGHMVWYTLPTRSKLLANAKIQQYLTAHISLVIIQCAPQQPVHYVAAGCIIKRLLRTSSEYVERKDKIIVNWWKIGASCTQWQFFHKSNFSEIRAIFSNFLWFWLIKTWFMIKRLLATRWDFFWTIYNELTFSFHVLRLRSL